ncbi:hypothetical protein CROQUDRAFT_78994 [Cronartium quercuum f. sp. fusiforme G11]|uniref:GH16 domain-containing protein n=1 Tax=Cronartium quercuum f. sp. fusiforme G11 TaxID=708437 RepID=A0A9P6TAH9_9BASI|nr:hypothetical protein CROQUDRAFT_78994 [Cronartium quercuum f. sp. fusiforme G11]
MRTISSLSSPSKFTILLALIACFGHFADAKKHKKATQHTKKAPSSYGSSDGKTWKVKSQATGHDILNFFNFETSNQGSQGGSAGYVDLQEGYRSSMVGDKDGVLYLGVDTTPYAPSRKSLRLSSKDTLSAGTLVVVDVLHMPAACGAWPALWTVARDGEWPQKGEIDIVEGVNLFTQNSMSVHTKPGFWMKTAGFLATFMLGGDQQANCDVSATNDQGCGLRDTNKKSFGEPYNAGKGGYHVLEWTNDAINVYFFPRGSEPADIASGRPSKSSSWGQPSAKFQGSGGQSTADYFQEHVLVVNTNLCGQWPEGVWNADASYAGQSESCAAITGYATCQEFITNGGSKLGEAYWALKSIKVYE